MTRTVRAMVTGRVQGVGYRAWCVREASANGLRGWVRHRRSGEVEVLLSGDDGALERMLKQLEEGPEAANVEAVIVEKSDDEVAEDFGSLPTL